VGRDKDRVKNTITKKMKEMRVNIILRFIVDTNDGIIDVNYLKGEENRR